MTPDRPAGEVAEPGVVDLTRAEGAGADVAEDAGGAGPAERGPAGREERRLRGVDAARGVALIGMMCVHILPLVGVAGVVHAAAAGRSAALFATLAGVGLALASGGDTPPTGAALWRASVARP